MLNKNVLICWAKFFKEIWSFFMITELQNLMELCRDVAEDEKNLKIKRDLPAADVWL